MDEPTIHPSQVDVRLTTETPSSPTTSLSAAPSVSVLNNANNTRVKNSTFSITTNNYNTYANSSAALSLDLLYKSAAPNAILNSGGRADEVRCHPGTREEVIGLVEKSIANDYNGPRLLWLSGPAGAGKSAIMQTVAERCKRRGVPQANFFFFRGDSSRSHASPLVATLMHQVIKLYPSVGPAVAAALESDPLLLQMDLQQQFDTLLHQAFTTVQESSPSPQPLTLLIDGLDECNSDNKTAQRQLLQALDTLLIQKGPYFRIVVASRVEPQISMAFKQLDSQFDSIFLDEQYYPENDIRLFVTAEFDKIKSTHYLADSLSPNWPSASDIDEIVSKSSGQFIYAATVMRFISQSSASPVLSLQKVQGIVPPRKNTPFAHLDAVYTYILDQVDDEEAVKDIFTIRLLGVDTVSSINACLNAYCPRYSEAVFNSCISELTSLIDARHKVVQFFHASFVDFLMDKSRAKEYHIDLKAFCTAAFPKLWVSRPGIEIYDFAITTLQYIEQPTPEVTAALMAVHPGILARGNLSKIDIHRRMHVVVTLINTVYSQNNYSLVIGMMRKWMADDKGLREFIPNHMLTPHWVFARRSGGMILIDVDRHSHLAKPEPVRLTPTTGSDLASTGVVRGNSGRGVARGRGPGLHPRRAGGIPRPGSTRGTETLTRGRGRPHDHSIRQYGEPITKTPGA